LFVLASTTKLTFPHFSFGGTPVVTIKVGPQEIPFIIHKSIICSASPFFRRALEGQFKEGEESVVSLPEEDEETFESFMNVVYNEYRNLSKEWARTWKIGSLFDRMISLHIFADKIGMITLQNEIIKDFFCRIARPDNLECYPLTAIYRLYHPSAAATEPLRKITIAQYTYRFAPNDFKEDNELQDIIRDPKVNNFAADLLLSMARRYGIEKADDPLKKGYEQFFVSEPKADKKVNSKAINA
jgi:BTB/POZ domain